MTDPGRRGRVRSWLPFSGSWLLFTLRLVLVPLSRVQPEPGFSRTALVDRTGEEGRERLEFGGLARLFQSLS